MLNKLKLNLLNLNGVTRFNIDAPRLERYLLHDKPFAVFCANENLHLKLPQAKCRELLACLKGIVKASSVYNVSSRWIMLNPLKLEELDIWQLALQSYALALNEISDLSRLTLLQKNSTRYSIDHSAIMQKINTHTSINFNERINFEQEAQNPAQVQPLPL